MWIAKGGSSYYLCVDRPRKDDYDTWEANDYVTLTTFTKYYREDGSYWREMKDIQLEGEFSNLKFADGPIEIMFVTGDSGPFWMARNSDGTLSVFIGQPEKNEMHPWWSGPRGIDCPDNCTLDDFIKNLTWDDAPIRVDITKKK